MYVNLVYSQILLVVISVFLFLNVFIVVIQEILTFTWSSMWPFSPSELRAENITFEGFVPLCLSISLSVFQVCSGSLPPQSCTYRVLCVS